MQNTVNDKFSFRMFTVHTQIGQQNILDWQREFSILDHHFEWPVFESTQSWAVLSGEFSVLPTTSRLAYQTEGDGNLGEEIDV